MEKAMKVIKKCLDIKPKYNFDRFCDNKEIVFFDIETTGLSAINSVLYLIGVAFYEEDSWQFVQWFADECDDEAKIIDAFFEILDNKKYLIHYNGNGIEKQ